MTEFKEEDYNKDFDFGLWKKLLYYLKPLKKEVLILATVMMGVGGIDAIFPLMTKYAIDKFVVNNNISALLRFSLLYGVLIIVQAINVWLLINYAGKIETTMTYNIRKAGFKRLQELSFSYYDKTAVGWLMARMTSDVKRLGEVLSWGFVDSVWGITMMITTMVIMLFLNWKLALITLSVVPILAVISLYFQKKILKLYRKVRKINSKITGAFNEGIMGAKTTKTLVREEDNLREFEEKTTKMRESSVKAAIFSALYLPVVLTLGSIGTSFALVFGGRDVLLTTISYGTLVAFISYTVHFFEPISQLARVFAELQSAQASAERTLSMIETKPDIQDSQEVIEIYGDTFTPKRENWSEIKGDISFKNVSFAYEDGEQILEDFNLEIKAGETIALVGETGSGKSTIVNLACRFYEPTAGEILIDGVDYKKRSKLWLHSNIGYVLQTPHLFSGTIKDNIRYGNLEASDLDIIKAAKLVNAHQLIKKLEQGYDTKIGEGGGSLSTGEKQLISFARAVLADPRIFVLDEATSSIDTEMEQIIQQAIDKLLKGRTNFIIAHRLSTIRSADRILVLRDGEIIESGNHQELLRSKGYYYKLYTNQFMKEGIV
ncbi:ABC transporter ATP-binding protein [Orenia metallireducens]|uniref:ABC transporter ATP-binding protein n=1 Tax=Orenia metallireducens TaxID=1413210 RepID=A0A1C0ACG5_9FIRM|nr:ABC transporter ATP-binding protein [Orenia metallireducens]OCL28057.1 ABC transporter ATP-binding protein [Orenia metallireducens]